MLQDSNLLLTLTGMRFRYTKHSTNRYLGKDTL